MDIVVPLNKKVVVELKEQEKVTPGGIFIPETTNQKAPTSGRVVQIAEDSDIRFKIQPGDIVLFSKYSGTDITIAGKDTAHDKKYQIMKDEDILAVIKKGDNNDLN